MVKRRDTKTGDPIDGFANTHHILMQAYSHAMQRNHAKGNAPDFVRAVAAKITQLKAVC